MHGGMLLASAVVLHVPDRCNDADNPATLMSANMSLTCHTQCNKLHAASISHSQHCIAIFALLLFVYVCVCCGMVVQLLLSHCKVRKTLPCVNCSRCQDG